MLTEAATEAFADLGTDEVLTVVLQRSCSVWPS